MKKRLLSFIVIALIILQTTAFSSFALPVANADDTAAATEERADDIAEDKTDEASAGNGVSAETADKGSTEDKGKNTEPSESNTQLSDERAGDGKKREDEPRLNDETEPAKTAGGTLVYECEDYTVTLKYGGKAGIPEGTRLDVREILADSKDKKERKEYNEYFDKSLEQLRSEKGGDSIATLGFARFYDITLIADGREIEPESDVKVTFTYNKDARESVYSEANKASGRKTEDAVKIVHLTESGKTGELEAAAVGSEDTDLTVEKKELAETAFTTDSFSVYGIVYTVDFEYEGHTFSIAGESEILLSGIFERLDIEEDVQDVQEVTFTDPELIKVEAVDEGDWRLTSLKPFDTTETLTVKLPEKIIEITVTDDQIPAGMEDAVARVSADDGATWSYHTTMSSAANAGNAPAADTLTDRGALTYASTLTGSVIVETLKKDCTLGSATTFNKNANITLRTMSGLGFTSTIHRGFGGNADAATALIRINGASTYLTTENITFDGTDGTNLLTGRAIHVNSGGLTVKDGSTFRNFSTPNVGGAIYSAQVKNTIIQGSHPSKILFENCGTTGSGSDYDGGGAIAFIQGTKDAGRVAGATFIDCYTKAGGGAIYVRTSSGYNTPNTFTVTNCVFDGHENLAEGTTNARWGGAIYVWDGWFALSGCTFTDCTATVDGGSVYTAAGQGDRVELIADCTFNGHDTLKDNILNAQTGGAIRITSGDKGIGCIRNITVTNCRTSGAGGGAYFAIPVEEVDGEINFSNCKTTNSDGDGGGIYFGSSVVSKDTTRFIFDNCHSGGSGGGIYFSGYIPLIKNSEFTDCSAGATGGSIFLNGSGDGVVSKLESCMFNGHDDDLARDENNAANAGGIYLSNGSLELVDCNFTNLTAKTKGGAVWMDGGSGDTLTLIRCTINGNDGKLTEDGVTVKNANQGGGIWINANSGTKLNDVVISDCWTSDNGGGLYFSDSNDTLNETTGTVSLTDCYTTGGKGGGAFFGSNASFGKEGATDNHIITFTRCHDDSTSTSNGGGGAFFNKSVTLMGDTELKFDSCHAASYGGGAWFNDATTLNNGTINFNDCYAAKRGGGGYFANTATLGNTVSFTECYTDSSGTSDGGGGAWFNSTATFNSGADVTFDKCYTASSGGGAYFNAAATLNNQTASFKDCYAEKNGGGAYFGGNVVNTLTGITFTDCKAGWAWDENAQKFVSVAGGNGGGLYKNDGNLTANDITFSGCYASANGGAAYYAPDDTFTLNGASITRCSVEAGGRGSAIFVNSSGKVNFNGGTADGVNGVSIKNNTGGGAVEVNSNSAILTFSGNVLVYDNTAKDGQNDVQKNVVLDRNTNTVIKTATTGLGNDAHIGVFVTDGEFTRHGEVNDPFGTWQTTDINLEKFTNDRDDKLFGVSHPGDNLIYWGKIICKIIDVNGGEHVFPTLNSAVKHARTYQTDYVDGVCTVQMLVDYVIPKYDVVTLNNSSDNFVFTTAATEDNLPAGEQYFFEPTFTQAEGRLDTDSKETAILQRGWSCEAAADQSLFYLNSSNAKLSTTNLIMDGKSNTSGALAQYTGRAIYANAGTLTIDSNSTLRNFKTPDDGGAVYSKVETTVNDADFKDCVVTGNNKSGGALSYNASGKTLTINDSRFDGHERLNNSTVNATSGGAINVDAGNLTVSGSTEFKDCTAGSNGGAINMNGANAILNIENCKIIGHDSLDPSVKNATQGGAIRTAGKATIKDIEVRDCFSSGDGGGIYSAAQIEFTDGTALIKDCYSKGGKGGGAYFGSTATFEDEVIFSGCHADSTSTSNGGGGVWFNSNCTLSSDAIVTFDSCYSASYGGGAWFNAATTLNNGTINFNECYAAKNGGGAYFNNTATLGGTTTFTKCHADTAGTSNGGGAYFNKAATLKQNVSFTDCYTGAKGGAIYFTENSSMTGVTVNGHAELPGGTDNAQLGGALYLASGKTLNIKDGSITNCSASDAGKGGAVNVGGNGCKLFFEGDAYVFGNPATSTAIGDQRNVVLDYDTNTVIQTTTSGLTGRAQIGVYVTGNNPTTSTSDQFYKHGRLGAPYGTYGKNGDYTYFINDRLSTGGALVRGVEKKASDRTNIMYWAIDQIPAPTNVVMRYAPYLFILGGTILLLAASRRRKNRED